jgi:NDP-sugar pyrophosphorylase family protein
MKIIIPMAGSGDRFVNAGYTDPKPLIKVRGKRIVEYVCDMFDKDNDDFVFICNERHLATTDMEGILSRMVNKYKIVSMPVHKLGPVYTVLAAETEIEDDEPVVIAYCDNPVKWDYDDFRRFVLHKDGCIVSHTGFHPHTLGATLFAYSKTDTLGRVAEIKEKSCYTSNRFEEHASSGIYYFKHGSYIKKYFKKAIADNVNYNGEFYVTLVYNLLIKDELTVYSYLNDEVLAFGTPNEVRNYEAWQIILEGAQVGNVGDAIDCYNYWKGLKNETNNIS